MADVTKEITPEIVSEETNSKKQKKKISFIEKNKIPIIAISIVVIIALIYFLFFFSPYKFRFDIDSVSYVSNEYVPTQFFTEFSQNKTVYVSPILTDGVTDSLTFNALNLWQIVLIGNNINAIQMIRVKDKEGKFTSCYTNDGNVYVSRQVSFEECSTILNDSKNTVIFIEQSKEEKVLLEKNKLSVFSSVNSVSAINFKVMKQIFPNAKTLIDIVNEKIYGIQ